MESLSKNGPVIKTLRDRHRSFPGILLLKQGNDTGILNPLRIQSTKSMTDLNRRMGHYHFGKSTLIQLPYVRAGSNT